VPVPLVRRRGMSMLMMLAPAALVASVIIVREFPARVHKRAVQRQAAPVAKQEPAPAPLPAPEVVVPAVPAPLPEVEKPVAVARRRGASSAQTARKPERNYAIRVTGGDPIPPVPAPVVPPPAPRVEEAAAPPVAESVEPPSAPPASPESPAPQEAAPAKAPSVGSRLVKALGKVNPFHKGAKHDTPDPAKAPLKQ